MKNKDENITMPDFKLWAENLWQHSQDCRISEVRRVFDIQQEIEKAFEQGRALGRRKKEC